MTSLKKKYKNVDVLIKKLKKKEDIEEVDRSLVEELYEKYGRRPHNVGYNRIRNNLKPIDVSVDIDAVFLSGRDWFDKNAGKVKGVYCNFFCLKDKRLYSGLDRTGKVANELTPLGIYNVKGSLWVDGGTTFNISVYEPKGKSIEPSELASHLFEHIKKNKMDIINAREKEKIVSLGEIGMNFYRLSRWEDGEKVGDLPIFAKEINGMEVKPYPGFSISVNSLLNPDERAIVGFHHQSYGKHFFGDLLTKEDFKDIIKSKDQERTLMEFIMGTKVVFIAYTSSLNQKETDGQVQMYRNMYGSFLIPIDPESSEVMELVDYLQEEIGFAEAGFSDEDMDELGIDVSVEETLSIEDFESSFEPDVEESTEELVTEEIVEGKKSDDYFEEDYCVSCGVLKNNISPSTGNCYECDEKNKSSLDDKNKKEDSSEKKAIGCLGEFDPDSEECKKCDKTVRCKQLMLENLEKEIGSDGFEIISNMVKSNPDIEEEKIAQKFNIPKNAIQKIKFGLS